MSAPIQVRRDGRIVRISLSRPPVNVLDRELNRTLATAVREHGVDPEISVIVVDGGSSRGFSGGVEVADHVPGRVEGMLEDFHGAIHALWDADCVTVAAVHGFALGGGLELAMSCDMVVAESQAELGLPEIRLGCYPPVAAALLPVRVGWGLASELVLTGETFPAERGRDMGLVNRVCEQGELQTEVQGLVDSLLEKSPAVLREAKHALREGTSHSAHDALMRIERRYLGPLMSLEDAQEGIRAFMEKRAPAFKNR